MLFVVVASSNERSVSQVVKHVCLLGGLLVVCAEDARRAGQKVKDAMLQHMMADVCVWVQQRQAKRKRKTRRKKEREK